MRRFLVVFVVAITFEGMAWGQSQTVYKLRREVDLIAGFWSADYLKDHDTKNWCMPSTAEKKISGTLALSNDGVTFTPNKGASACTIQYKDIVSLSRGNAGSPSATGPPVTIAASLGAILTGVLKSTVAKTNASGKVTTTSVTTSSLALTGALAAAAVIAGIIWYRGGLKENFIAITYDTNDTENAPSGCQTVSQVNQKPAPLFHKGNLMIFQLKSRADYWETSTILSAATGCEFASITAENK